MTEQIKEAEIEKRGIVKLVFEQIPDVLDYQFKDHLARGGQLTMERDPNSRGILVYLFGVKHTQEEIDQWAETDLADAVITLE